MDSLTLLTAGTAAAFLMYKGHKRLMLSRAKHPGLSGHVRMAKRVSRLLPAYSLEGSDFYACDGATAHLQETRQRAFEALGAELNARAPKGKALLEQALGMISDTQFTHRYRVPFQFQAHVNAHLLPVLFLQKSAGHQVWDVDGNEYLDVTGAYGTNLLGLDTYKHFIRQAAVGMDDLGPVLGPYHPIVLDNCKRILDIAGQDEISFHMSGTEAVMQAVRLAQYHTGRERIVRFAGAYHGWWGDVQPGIGNPVSADRTLTLQEMGERTLAVLASRKDIACVLVNPLQALHPNTNAPGDSSLISSARKAGYNKAAYTEWLQKLRRVCTDNGIVLIFDEVFLGFRLAKGGAQEYFGVRADMVTYGKTLGGGLPVGVLCGRAELMRRYRKGKPADICFARGTFNSHPYVMHSMNLFLQHLETDTAQAMYSDVDALWDGRAQRLNELLTARQLPVQVSNMTSVWTILYNTPSRFNWMFQFYLLQAGVMLSWVGSGRMIFPHSFTEADFDMLCERFVKAAQAMSRDGWWDCPPACDSNKKIQRRVLSETWRALTSSIGSINWPLSR